MKQQIAGKTLNIEGKDVRCPSLPLFFVKSFGHVIDVQQRRYDAEQSFDSCIGSFREIWELDRKGMWRIVRRMRNGREG